MGAICPWDIALTFWDPTWEEGFWDTRVNNALWNLDRWMHSIGLVGAAIMVIKHPSNLMVLSCAAALLGLGAAQAYWSLSHSSSYMRWRSWNLAVYRIWIVTLVTVSACFSMESGAGTDWPSLARLVVTSNIPALLCTGIGLQLRFKTHVIVQFVSTCIAMLFVPSYCMRWEIKNASGFQCMGAGIQSAIGILMMGTEVKSSQTYDHGNIKINCWLSVSFVQWSLGFLLPAAFVYCNESYTRVLYIVSTMHTTDDERQRLWRMWRENILLSLWYLLVGMTVIWAALNFGSKYERGNLEK